MAGPPPSSIRQSPARVFSLAKAPLASISCAGSFAARIAVEPRNPTSRQAASADRFIAETLRWYLASPPFLGAREHYFFPENPSRSLSKVPTAHILTPKRLGTLLHEKI